ncbi:hypothetical protein STAL104432_31065 [Streptomyces albus]
MAARHRISESHGDGRPGQQPRPPHARRHPGGHHPHRGPPPRRTSTGRKTAGAAARAGRFGEDNPGAVARRHHGAPVRADRAPRPSDRPGAVRPAAAHPHPAGRRPAGARPLPGGGRLPAGRRAAARLAGTRTGGRTRRPAGGRHRRGARGGTRPHPRLAPGPDIGVPRQPRPGHLASLRRTPGLAGPPGLHRTHPLPHAPRRRRALHRPLAHRGRGGARTGRITPHSRTGEGGSCAPRHQPADVRPHLRPAPGTARLPPARAQGPVRRGTVDAPGTSRPGARHVRP